MSLSCHHRVHSVPMFLPFPSISLRVSRMSCRNSNCAIRITNITCHRTTSHVWNGTSISPTRSHSTDSKNKSFACSHSRTLIEQLSTAHLLQKRNLGVSIHYTCRAHDIVERCTASLKLVSQCECWQVEAVEHLL